MKISRTILKDLTVRTKTRIALEFNCSFATVDRWIRKNEANSQLTTVKALEIIKEETGLSDQEILEEEKQVHE